MNQGAKPQPAMWTPDAIREEVRRRRLSLTGIARAAGLAEDACRKALHGYNRKGADALSDALGIPFDTLFPEGFIQSRRETNVNSLIESRQKRVRPTDSAGAR